MISIALDDTSPGAVLMNILAASIGGACGNFVAWVLSYFPPTVGQSCSVGNQARGGAAGWAKANMAYGQVRRLSGRHTGLRAADAPRTSLA